MLLAHAPGYGAPSATAAAARGLAAERREHPLGRYTEATVTDRDKLAEELRGVQLRLRHDLEEFCAGLQCVAAPVRDASQRVVAAISLSGPSLRLTEEALHGAAAAAITKAAARLSRELGSAA
ncbi:MAG: IclR family transcriptional regulator C-terminal domain-containing protein [Myxococcota bacterium]